MSLPLTDKENELRLIAENDLIKFIELVAPHRMLGHVHQEIADWWQRTGKKPQDLILIPRAHQKSALMAYRVAQRIAKDPTVTFIYISGTANLAEKQLGMIKQIVTSPAFTRYWPNHFQREEGKRSRWTTTEINTDHPLRDELGIRDPTVFIAGLTTTITGLHCDVAVLDDVVVPDNAYTEEGRRKVAHQCSDITSVLNPGGEVWAAGTRYHPNDFYSTMMEMVEEIFNDEGEMIGAEPVYEIFERQVEDRGDGTGQFLWPKQRRADGKFFGFDIQELAKKRAMYSDKGHYYAQYYNDPNKGQGGGISREMFQYYEPRLLTYDRGKWHYKDRPLNIFAAMDFGFSVNKKADYSAIVVVGIDPSMDIFVLDISRFKTDSPAEYFRELVELKQKWDFKKVSAEVSGTQGGLVKALKEDHIKPNGLSLTILESRPTRHDGTKQERIHNTLYHRYENRAMYHYRGGNAQILEEELTMRHPPHDDVKDALAQAVEICVAPINRTKRARTGNVIQYNRFGGMS